jgi:hypothetical protein
MTVKVSLDHNIGSVISDVDDVKSDLRDVFRTVRRALSIAAEDARMYVRADADWRGRLRRAIGVESDARDRGKQRYELGADPEIAPWAVLIEYGTGTHTDQTQGASVAPPGDFQDPPGKPYETPDIDYNEESLMDFEGFGGFFGFTKTIQEWMETKPVEPEFDPFVSAALIARQIIEEGQYAHPFLRPAWFHNEKRVRRAARNQIRRAVR